MDPVSQATLWKLAGIFASTRFALDPRVHTYAEFKRETDRQALRIARQDIATLLAWKVLTS